MYFCSPFLMSLRISFLLKIVVSPDNSSIRTKISYHCTPQSVLGPFFAPESIAGELSISAIQTLLQLFHLHVCLTTQALSEIWSLVPHS